MNYRLLSQIFGILLLLIAACLFLCFLMGVIEILYGETNAGTGPLAISAALTGAIGAALFVLGRKADPQILRKEAVVVVGGGWFVSAFFGAIPYLLCEPRMGFADAYFESMSGFTTTGSTVIGSLDIYPRAILLWRSFTQWIGGIGILVLFVALLSYLGVGGKSLLQFESSMRAGEPTNVRIRKTAVMLWMVYLSLSLFTFAGLFVLGMSPYDALNHTFAAVATGGFSTHDESIAWFHSPSIEWFLTVVMFLASVNLLLYPVALRRDWNRLKVEEEGRLFLFIVLGAVLLVFTVLLQSNPTGHSVSSALRGAAFQVVTIVSTTGFASEDFDQWPWPAKTILLGLMIIGGCAGSTAGGVKVGRVLLFFKEVRNAVVGAFRPRQVFAVRLNGMAAGDLSARVPIFLAMFGLFVFLGTAVLSFLQPHEGLVSCLSATLAALFNIGPGLDSVGPTRNFAHFDPPACLLLSFLMAVGRLEMFAVLSLFVPALWRKY